jgi:hypothetical protein
VDLLRQMVVPKLGEGAAEGGFAGNFAGALPAAKLALQMVENRRQVSHERLTPRTPFRSNKSKYSPTFRVFERTSIFTIWFFTVLLRQLPHCILDDGVAARKVILSQAFY